MRPRSLPLLAALAAFVTLTPSLGAQLVTSDSTDGAQAAYLALSLTPMGALTPMVSAREAGMPARSTGFRFQFANRDDGQGESRRSWAGGLDVPFGQNTLGFTLGYVDVVCDDAGAAEFGFAIQCKGALMGGADFAVPLVRHPLAAGDASSLVIGTVLSAGAGHGNLIHVRDDSNFVGGDIDARATAWSAGIQLPVALVLKSEGLTVVPNLRPGLGYGHAKVEFAQGGVTGSASDGGARFVLGGGVGLLFRSTGIGLDLGFHKTFVKDSKTLLGVGLSYTGR